DTLRVVERFTPADTDTLSYQLTVEDPKTWAKPWTVSFPLKRSKDYAVYEYACHEGNYYMYNALSGSRSEEKKKGDHCKTLRSASSSSVYSEQLRGPTMLLRPSLTSISR